MARKLFVVALIFVVMISMVMAEVAPSTSPKSSPLLESAPKAAPSISSAPKASPKASPSPSSSPIASPLAPSLAPSTSDNEEGISSPPAQASGPIELYAPGAAPVNDDGLAPEVSPAADAATGGASAIQFSVVAASTVAFVSFFAI
ncbi:unnamed protein product [Lathyrus sativus]|nr:unnamed protein product [Lathyrus sativus]